VTVTILKTENGVLDEADQPALQALAARLKAKPDARILLHLHGGLVPEDKGVEIARRLGGPVDKRGFGYGAEVEQVFVVWRTGALETLKANWTDLFDNDRLYKVLVKRVLSFLADKLGVPGEGGGGRSAFAAAALTPTEIAARLEARPSGDPFADVDVTLENDHAGGRGPVVAAQTDGALAQEFTLLLQKDQEFNRAADDIAAALTFDPPTGRSLSPRGDAGQGQQTLDNLNADLKAGLLSITPPAPSARLAFTGFQVAQFLIKHAAKIAVRVVRRFRAKRDHGFYATTVEEIVRECYGDLIGAAVWGMMKRDAGDHFAGGGLGTALITALTQAKVGKLTVSAHSAGAIWLSQFLIALAATPGAPKVRVALLAPAVRIDLFAEAIGKAGPLIEALRIFTMRDDLERKDGVLGHNLGFIYPSSLLYLVSGAFEEANSEAFPDAPILGMQRFLTYTPGWLGDPEQIAAVGATMALLAKPSYGVVFSQIDDGPGQASQATAHGDFDQDAPTLASVVQFL
jgi:hypothetical protein